MTEGKILKPLIIFAIPYILSNILQNIYTLADTAIAGQLLGLQSFAAVFASQNYGAGNMERIKSAVRKIILLLFGLSACILAFSLTFSPAILKFMIKEGEKSVIQSGNMYLTIRMLSAFALVPAACLKTVLPGLKRTLYPTISGFAEVAIRFVSPVILVKNWGFLGVPLTDTITWCFLALFFIAAYPSEMKKAAQALRPLQ